MEHGSSPPDQTEHLSAETVGVPVDQPLAVQQSPDAAHLVRSPENSKLQSLAERHPDWPPIHVTMYLSGHTVAEDWEPGRPLFQQSQIVMLEDPANDIFTIGMVQELADTQLTEAELEAEVERMGVRDSFKEVLMRAVAGTGVAIGRFDLLPDDAVTNEEYDEALSDPDVTKLDFDEYLDEIRDRLARLARLEQQRNQIMSVRFEEEMQRILADRPQLRAQPNLEVLVTMGAGHTLLYHDMRARGIDVDPVFSRQRPYVYDHWGEAVRQFELSQQPPSRDLLAKAYMDRLLSGAIWRNVQVDLPEDDLAVYTRAVAEKFSTDEIEQIYASR